MKVKKKPAIAGIDGGPSKSAFAGSQESYSNGAASARQNEPRPGSQRAVILQALKNAGGDWVGVDVLMRKARSCAVHSQVAALRSLYGLTIKNKMERAKDGVQLSYYRLEEGGSE